MNIDVSYFNNATFWSQGCESVQPKCFQNTFHFACIIGYWLQLFSCLCAKQDASEILNIFLCKNGSWIFPKYLISENQLVLVMEAFHPCHYRSDQYLIFVLGPWQLLMMPVTSWHLRVFGTLIVYGTWYLTPDPFFSFARVEPLSLGNCYLKCTEKNAGWWLLHHQPIPPTPSLIASCSVPWSSVLVCRQLCANCYTNVWDKKGHSYNLPLVNYCHSVEYVNS